MPGMKKNYDRKSMGSEGPKTSKGKSGLPPRRVKGQKLTVINRANAGAEGPKKRMPGKSGMASSRVKGQKLKRK